MSAGQQLTNRPTAWMVADTIAHFKSKLHVLRNVNRRLLDGGGFEDIALVLRIGIRIPIARLC